MLSFNEKVGKLFTKIVDNGGENLQLLYSDKENDFLFFLSEIRITEVPFNFMDVLVYAFIEYIKSKKVNVKKLTFRDVKKWLEVCLKTDYIYKAF